MTTTFSILDFASLTLRYAGRGSNDSKICIFLDMCLAPYHLLDQRSSFIILIAFSCL